MALNRRQFLTGGLAVAAAGMGLTEVAQVYQRSGLELVYKLNQD